MNKDTCVVVHCWEGDKPLVERHLPQYLHHQAPVLVLSPADSPVIIPGVECQQAGQRAYIGQTSLDRQRQHLEILAARPEKYFLLNDADSFFACAEIPRRLYDQCENTVWSNEVPEPRPHASPYPKLAFQPPYWLNKASLLKIIEAFPKVGCHPITPYIDFWMNAWSAEAGLAHRPFTDLEHAPRNGQTWTGTDPWGTLDFRIRFMGCVAQHPIKTPEAHALIVEARKFYELANGIETG